MADLHPDVAAVLAGERRYCVVCADNEAEDLATWREVIG